MKLLVVSDEAPLGPKIRGATRVSARDYLSEPAYGAPGAYDVLNLCRSYRYQTLGYYVSLLAEARGHRPRPQAATIGDLASRAVLDARALSPERPGRRTGRRPRLAVLIDPDNAEPPSNPEAMRLFLRAARRAGLRMEAVAPGDIGRLAEYDALFIRDTTSVNHHSYRFARRAAALGLPVIDDPDSIMRCSNKVYLAELFARHGIATPRTLLVHRGNADRIVPELALPCVLKEPDSCGSVGVMKAHTEAELAAAVPRLLARSALIVAQEFLPTPFDWRVGVLDRKALFACRYYMAEGHWQVIKRERARKLQEGPTRAVPVDAAPPEVIRLAVDAAGLIGDGLYGVDIKQLADRCVVIEVNDNPNVDAGNEDSVLGEALYGEIMGVFARRVAARRERPRR